MRERTFNLDPTAITIQNIRNEHGLQSKIARDLSVSPQRLYNWLTAKKGIPESYLRHLALAAEIPMLDLLDQESRKFFSTST